MKQTCPCRSEEGKSSREIHINAKAFSSPQVLGDLPKTTEDEMVGWHH